MELTFKTEKKKTGIRYLKFLPKNLRPIALAAIIVNLLAIIFVAIFYFPLQKEIPLFYSLSSDQQLADKKFLLLLPAIATLINAAHLLVAYFEKEINDSILKMFIEITLLLQVLLFAILLRIIIIVS
jgi:hypothetical protein